MAVAAYFQTLRDNRRAPNGKRLTQAQLARAVGKHLRRKVDQSTISKIESGKETPMGDVMAAMLTVLGGRLEDVLRLAGSEDAPDKGRELAREVLVAEIPTEGELERLIADWHADEQMQRSLRRVWRARSGIHATGDANQ